jgi:hypothetical protein
MLEATIDVPVELVVNVTGADGAVLYPLVVSKNTTHCRVPGEIGEAPETTTTPVAASFP